MSSDRRPAKVRVVSSGQGQASDIATASTPARRRGDRPGTEAVGEGEVALVADKPQGASLVWAISAVALFLLGCLIGGGLLMLSGLVSTADL